MTPAQCRARALVLLDTAERADFEQDHHRDRVIAAAQVYALLALAPVAPARGRKVVSP